MLEVPIYNTDGQKVGAFEVDENRLGGEVNVQLLKQAVVAYHSARRQGTVATKGRAQVAGSTKKLYAQKHTGRARRGNLRTNVMRGGGVGFPKLPRSYRLTLPKQMKKGALDSAILAKIIGNDMMMLDGLKVDAPKTKVLANIMDKLQIKRSCLMAVGARDRNVYLSSRNLQDLTVMPASDLNAFDVATRQKMIVTREAMEAILAQEGGK
jgi:large subunit ribosomal protein L4